MILFLDFDGVLHPASGGRPRHFCYLPRLEALLREFPEVKVVVCSDWRLNHSLDQLRDFFSEDIRTRVIDVTPALFPRGGFRFDEATYWALERHYFGPWVALDDTKRIWYEGRGDPPWLVLCDDGFGDEEEAGLRALLNPVPKQVSPLLFLNTEFNHPDELDLISIGLVASDGRSFYAERSDFDRRRCAKSVKRSVLPLLGADSTCVMPLDKLKATLRDWLCQFQDSAPILCAVRGEDACAMRLALDNDIPIRVIAHDVKAEIDDRRHRHFFWATRLPRNHALNEARANRFAYCSSYSHGLP